ncbi:hypothetical protein [Streptomyces mobaraensis]|uniref:Uncharacterized protein n=1 Tax=Streptomyces mobaraensis TaxID=35621 RepID=A0A5N5VWX8_STRMB|nr:hypothetical protein [Streptomyces mobaraensis]KAB7832668.1 hypothetical protein FRZ00_34660 [Streptomyces mobaraensis]
MKRRDSSALKGGYWCSCAVVFGGVTDGPKLVTAFDARSAAEAVISVIVAMEMMAVAPEEKEATAARARAERTQAASSLIAGQMCTYTVARGELEVTWTIRPVLFLPLADRSESRLPTCSRRFTTYPFRPLLPPQPTE